MKYYITNSTLKTQVTWIIRVTFVTRNGALPGYDSTRTPLYATREVLKKISSNESFEYYTMGRMTVFWVNLLNSSLAPSCPLHLFNQSLNGYQKRSLHSGIWSIWLENIVDCHRCQRRLAQWLCIKPTFVDWKDEATEKFTSTYWVRVNSTVSRRYTVRGGRLSRSPLKLT